MNKDKEKNIKASEFFNKIKGKLFKKDKAKNGKSLWFWRILIFFIVIIVSLPFWLTLYTYVTLSKIEFEDITSVRKIPENRDGNKFILLLVGTDEDVSGRSFIDFISIIEFEFQRKEIRVLNLNPKFAPYFISESENLTFKNLIATDESFEGLRGVDFLIDRVERFSAIRIDSYILISKEDFSEIFGDLGSIKIVSQSDVEDPDLSLDFSINKGENNVDMSSFIAFIAADSNGQNDKLARQLSAFESFVSQSKFFRLVYAFVSKSEKVSESIKTNLTIYDFSKLWVWTRLSKPSMIVGYIESHPVYVLDTGFGEIWRPVYENIDRDIVDVFTNKDAKIEQAKIDVLNGTDIGGLATSRGRWLENRGLRVVVTGNQVEKIGHNQLFVENTEEYKWTVYEIQEILRGDVEIKNQKYSGRSVGDLVLVLGENEVWK